MLTAYERTLAKKFKLINYFSQNNIYLLFIVQMRKIMNDQFGGVAQAEWAKNGLAHLAEEFLRRSEKLFQYANNIYAADNKFKNISQEDWDILCSISSKIIVEMGWEYDAKE